MSEEDPISKRATQSLRSRRLGLRAYTGADPLVTGNAFTQGTLAADGTGELGHRLATWLAHNFNHNFDDYDKAIDGVYNAGDGGSSAFHHLIDGQHSIWGAFQAVHDVSADDSFTTELSQAVEHLLRDTASISGVNPFFSLSPDEFHHLGDVASHLHITLPFLADALTVNGPELLGGSVA